MNWDQVKGVLDRVLAVGLTWFVAAGYIPSDMAATIASVIIGLASIAWGVWINRNKALVQGAATVPGTTIVTTPAMAASAPERNVVSSGSHSVVGRP